MTRQGSTQQRPRPSGQAGRPGPLLRCGASAPASVGAAAPRPAQPSITTLAQGRERLRPHGGPGPPNPPGPKPLTGKLQSTVTRQAGTHRGTRGFTPSWSSRRSAVPPPARDGPRGTKRPVHGHGPQRPARRQRNGPSPSQREGEGPRFECGRRAACLGVNPSQEHPRKCAIMRYTGYGPSTSTSVTEPSGGLPGSGRSQATGSSTARWQWPPEPARGLCHVRPPTTSATSSGHGRTARRRGPSRRSRGGAPPATGGAGACTAEGSPRTPRRPWRR